MAQHFLLSAAARSLSAAKVMRMSDSGVENVFLRLRWPATDGKPVCPDCGCMIVYDCRRPEGQPRWRCKACRGDFSITSGTLFAWRKLPLRTYMLAVVVFCNEVKGKSMLAFSRELDVQYKTAFVLAHKLREAMASSAKALRIGGEGKVAEIDGAWFGGHIRPENRAADRLDRRLGENQSANARSSSSCASARVARWCMSPRPRRPRCRRSASGSPEAPCCMPTGARPGTSCTPGSRCSGSTIKTATASPAPAPIARSPTSHACAAASLGITTTSPGHI